MAAPGVARVRRTPRLHGVRRVQRGRRPARGALVFLRGRDADARLRELAASRRALRPVLGALAGALVERRAYEALGYRNLADYARERLGLGARAVREWARVFRALEALPQLREAVDAGEVSFSVARRVVGIATPETEAACLETVRGRTVRAVEAILAALREAETAGGDEAAEDTPRVSVRLVPTAREATLWAAAVELARRTAGEPLPLWGCAERIAAEAASALGAPDVEQDGAERGAHQTSGPGACEPGLRERASPRLSWRPVESAAPARIRALAEGLEDVTPRRLDRRLRAAIAFLQSVDFETGRLLRQLVDRRLLAELGFASLARYAPERLDLSPRTARRLVALARTEHAAPAVAEAYRTGKLTAFQAQALLPVADLASARAWVARARRVTLRRLEDDLAARRPAAIVFPAPPEVAAFFLAMLARAGSLERLLAHAVATWVREGRQFPDAAVFERDGYRCTVPGCTARRALHSHHIRFRSAGGPDAPWNRTTLCAFHHQRGVHAGVVAIRGRAPDRLVYEFGGELYRSGDVRVSGPV